MARGKSEGEEKLERYRRMNKCFNCGDALSPYADEQSFGYCNECWKKHIEMVEAEQAFYGNIVTIGLLAAGIIAVGSLVMKFLFSLMGL